MGGLLLYINNNQAELLQREIGKLNQEHQGLISVGDSELSLFGNFPDVSIKIYDVSIHETKAENAAVIMDVADIYVGFNLWDIATGSLDIQSLLIEEGVFNLVIHTNNETNIQNALATTTDTATTNTAIHLKKIRLKNVDFHTYDEATQTDVEKFIYTAKGGFQIDENQTRGHIDTDLELNVIKAGDTTFIKHKHFEIHTDIAFDESSGVVTIDPSGIVMENGDFEIAGSIDTKNDMNLDLEIKGTKPNFDMLIAFAPTDIIPYLERYNNAGEIYFNAQINGPANYGNRPAITAEFGAGKAFLENTARGKKIDGMGFQGHFSNGVNRDASTMEFSVSDIRASLEKGEFNGSLLVKNFNAPEVDMKVDANFNLGLLAQFLELEQVQELSGAVNLKMNFHDIIDIENPEKALEQLNQAYFAELKVTNLSVIGESLPVPIDQLNVHLVMQGQEATLNQFDAQIGNSDVSIKGKLSNLPAVVHHSSIPVETFLTVKSNQIDIAELTGYSKQDSIPKGIDEQVKNLRLGLSFKTSAKDLTEYQYLPKGNFSIDSLYAELKHYPHTLHDFHADLTIDDSDLHLADFSGYIDDSDFHLDAMVHDYEFWIW